MEIFAVSSKARWWDDLALNEPSLPQQMSSCISCRPVGFIDRSSPGSVGAGAGALSSSWSGCWRLLAPLAALFEALSGARLSSYPAPLQPRLRTLVRRLLKIDEKNPAVSPHRFPGHMAGWCSVLLGKDLTWYQECGFTCLPCPLLKVLNWVSSKTKTCLCCLPTCFWFEADHQDFSLDAWRSQGVCAASLPPDPGCLASPRSCIPYWLIG